MGGAVNRREFLAIAASWPCTSGVADRAWATESQPAVLDLHVHLLGVGQGGTGCMISPAIQRGALFKLLIHKLGLRERAETLDEAYVLALEEQLRGSGLNRCLLIGQDAMYDAAGKPDWRRTQFYVPNDYVAAVARRFSDVMLPCASINPARRDAVDELDRCLAIGVTALKIHPPIQGVDIADKVHRKFFRRCAEAGALVLVHTGHERSAAVVDIELARPEKLRQALDEGCTVVACHSGSGRPTDRPDMLPEFVKLLHDYEREGTLWGDTAVLGSFLRSRDFGRLLADEFVASRLLHGSDFPFPSLPVEFAPRIGAELAASLQANANGLAQDFELKKALGIGQASAERAYQVVCGRGATADSK